MELDIKKLLRALLLSLGQPVRAKKFQEYVHAAFPERFLALSELKRAVEELNEELSSRAEPEEIAEGPEGYYFRLRPEFAEAVRAFKGEPKPQKISAAALETLSVIAYRQPITRSQVEAIRGVSCDGPVAKLLELELICGRTNETLPGRPTEFTTTDAFLQMCGLKSLEDLPQTEEGEDERLREFFAKSSTTTKAQAEVPAEVAAVATEAAVAEPVAQAE